MSDNKNLPVNTKRVSLHIKVKVQVYHTGHAETTAWLVLFTVRHAD